MSITTDTIIKEGELVYSLCWRSFEPGARSACENIYKHGGNYYGITSEGERYGPFPTLKVALGFEPFYSVSPATEDITCTEFTSDRVVSFLQLVGDEDVYFRINGEHWRVTPWGEFRHA